MTKIYITEEQYKKSQSSFFKISNTINVIYDYCKFNSHNEKIDPLIGLLSFIKNECTKITDKF